VLITFQYSSVAINPALHSTCNIITAISNIADLRPLSAKSLIPRIKSYFVDDEPDLTSLFKKVLESAGFNVNGFNNSNDALRDFKPHSSIY